MSVNRRDYLSATGGALLAASAMADSAEARSPAAKGDTLYGHGTVWNRELPGAAGAVNLSFDLRLDLKEGTGGGSAYDPVHQDWNIHFRIDSVERSKDSKGRTRYVLRGVVTEATNPDNVNLPLAIAAVVQGEGATAIAIGLGDLVFSGAGTISLEYLIFATIIAISMIVTR